MAEHTPTPWHVNDDRPLDDTSRLSISNGDARIIANIVTRETTHGFEGGSANAAFIVKAVNNHDAMDKLLAEAADYLNTHPGMDGMDLGNKITQFRLRMQADLIAEKTK